MIFGEDLRKPAFGDVNITVTVKVRHAVGPTDVEIVAIDIFQVHGDRVFAWVVVIDVASPVRSEICAAILIVLDLVLPVRKQPYEPMYGFMRTGNKPESYGAVYPS